MKASKILTGLIAVVIVVAAVAVVVGLPAGFLTAALQERVARETGYRLAIAGSTRVGLWPALNITMSEVTLEPKDRDIGSRLSIGSVQADITLTSLWSGKPDINELVITRPALSIPLRREREPTARMTQPTASPDQDPAAANIRRITISDGTVTLFNARDHVENHIEGISARATIGADRRVSLNGHARVGERALSFDVKALAPDPSQQRQTIPVELSLEAPGLLQAALTSKAEVRLNNTIVMINGISGTLGDGVFDGWASVDLASKPLVKLDLDFRRLDIAATAPQAAAPSAPPGWSNETIDLAGLNYVDAQVRLSSAELNIGLAHFAPVSLEASLSRGILTGRIANLGAYDGLVSGTIGADVSRQVPLYSLSCELTGVRAMPLLSGAADFDKLDGKLQARIDVRSSGQSQQAIMSNLAGTVVTTFQDGAIRGINVAQMIRSLTSGTLSGWQETRDQSTDLSQLSASFRIDKGQANTTDINLIGPLVKVTGAGTVDLGARTLALRVEPKLVLTTQGQGRTSDPVGFGIPVVIDGPWAAPHIYPDVQGILDNPDAAYGKLKQMGAGLFAPGGLGSAPPGGSDALGGKLGETLGNLIQQGLGSDRGRNNSTPSNPSNPSQPAQGAPQVNDILKQLFGR